MAKPSPPAEFTKNSPKDTNGKANVHNQSPQSSSGAVTIPIANALSVSPLEAEFDLTPVHKAESGLSPNLHVQEDTGMAMEFQKVAQPKKKFTTKELQSPKMHVGL